MGIWHRRQLLFLGRVAILQRSAHPPQLLMTAAVVKRHRGRPFRAIKDSFADYLKLMMNILDKRGSTRDWTGHAKVEMEWINIIKMKHSREREF